MGPQKFRLWPAQFELSLFLMAALNGVTAQLLCQELLFEGLYGITSLWCTQLCDEHCKEHARSKALQVDSHPTWRHLSLERFLT